MVQGRSLRIFVMGNNSRALKWVELVNWTGQAFIGRRDHIGLVRKRKELAEPGIYLLLSEGDNDGGAVEMYVGESDNFSNRLPQHQDKDWWSHFVVFVSKDKNLTKAHVKYLERRLHELGKQSLGTVTLRNSQEPAGSSIPEPDVSAMEEFLQNAIFVLETLGLSYFPASISEVGAEPSPSKEDLPYRDLKDSEFYMTLPKDFGSVNNKNLRGRLKANNGVYTLQKGSYVRAAARESFAGHSYWELWQQILNSDAVATSEFEGVKKLVRDIEFRSPSAAGAIVRGGQTNGRTDWKRISDDRSLGECEDELQMIAA